MVATNARDILPDGTIASIELMAPDRMAASLSKNDADEPFQIMKINVISTDAEALKML